MPATLYPIIPTEREQALARAGSTVLAGLMNQCDLVRLHTGDNVADEISLPTNTAQLVQTVLEQIGQGHSVVVLPLRTELTTSQAAGVIGVSRPFFVRLLEQGDIPFHKTGTHRRVRLRDVLAYKEEQARRVSVMRELIEETESMDLYR